MDALAESIRHQFIVLREIEYDEKTPTDWAVDIVIHHQSFHVDYCDEKDKCEWYANQLAIAMAAMIRFLQPDSLPIESPHFDIAAERRRQTMKGYTASHDDNHRCDELASAAALYALPLQHRTDEIVERLWPWDDASPPENDLGQRYSQLTKAGALIVAEMSRLNRATMAKHEAENV